MIPLVFCLIIATVSSAPDPAPRRVPKVYNALITSNQNLEPSKAFPVYQPVLHNAIHFPYQPVVYGEYPITADFLPVAALSPQAGNDNPGEVQTTAPEPAKVTESAETPVTEPSPKPKDKDAVPPPPATESPIPLNEFGLPPQILPIGRINSGYDLTQLNAFPYTYSYPGLRSYDPYVPFGLNPYASYPIYGPLNNLVAQYNPKLLGAQSPVSTPAPAMARSGDASISPPDPNDMNILNYVPQNPAIPNVPPPPLPQRIKRTYRSCGIDAPRKP